MSGSPTGLAGLVQQRQIDEAAAFEQDAADKATGDADDLMAEAVTAAAALWVTAFGSTTAVGAGQALARLLRQVTGHMQKALAGLGDRARRAILSALPQAVTLGARHGRLLVRTAGRRAPEAAGGTARPLPAAVREARRIGELVDDALSRAERLLGTGPDRFSGVAAALNIARSAISRVRAAVAWLIHQAVNTGADAVATDLRLGRLWIAELDACVRCAAYSGEYAAPGEEFDGGRSFDPQQKGHGSETLAGPPLHPHCRCRAVPWSARWGIGLPELLRARAAESVARGFALPSESGAARVRAARALLVSGRRLPPRVAEQARRAVRAGRFESRPART